MEDSDIDGKYIIDLGKIHLIKSVVILGLEGHMTTAGYMKIYTSTGMDGNDSKKWKLFSESLEAPAQLETTYEAEKGMIVMARFIIVQRHPIKQGNNYFPTNLDIVEIKVNGVEM